MSLSVNKLFANSRGDTIVEVVIAISILSVVLTGAYQTSKRAFDLIIDSQQRTQAINVAESQVEDLRNQAATSSFALFRNVDSCFQLTNNPATNNVPIDFKPDPSPAGPCVSQSIYLSKVSYVPQTGSLSQNPGDSGINEYEITVSYPNTLGQTSQVVIFYRVAVQ